MLLDGSSVTGVGVKLPEAFPDNPSGQSVCGVSVGLAHAARTRGLDTQRLGDDARILTETKDLETC